MADGESPKARPKRVKPDRPRPTTSSFRPTGGGSPRGGGPRTGGSGPRQGAGGPRPRGGFRPDSGIPRGPDERSAGDRPSFDRPSFDRPGSKRPGGRPRDDRSGGEGSADGRPAGDRGSGARPWPGRPQGDRPRFDGPRFDGPRPQRSGFGFRARPDGPGRWQAGPPPAGDRPVRDEGRGGDPTRRPDRAQFRDQGQRPRFEPGDEPFERSRPDRPAFDRTFHPSGGRPFGAERGRPDHDRPAPRPFGARPERPYADRGRPDFARPTTFNRPGLEPAEAGLIEAGDEVVAGRRPVEEAFVARREARRLLVVPQRRGALEKLVLHATSLRIPIVEVEGGSMTALTGFDGHQGIALVVAPRRYATVTDILARAIERGEAPFVLILDSLEDPQNVGTLLRSAEAAGAHGVIFPTRRQAPISPAAVKASAGAVEHLLLAPVDDLAGALADLHVAGLRVVGAEADAALTVREADLRGPIALVVGSEGQGLGPAVRRRCDLTVRIPMRGAIGSLNASVAGSILLFEAATQRDGAETPPVLKHRGGLPKAPRPASVPRSAKPEVVPVEAVQLDAPAIEAIVEASAVEPQAATEPKPGKAAKATAKIGKAAAKTAKSAAMATARTTAKTTAKATARTTAKPGSKGRKKAEADPETLDSGADLLP
jgi:23S rRNA (guanosine2251-2'-O)-methyltransferase